MTIVSCSSESGRGEVSGLGNLTSAGDLSDTSSTSGLGSSTAEASTGGTGFATGGYSFESEGSWGTSTTTSGADDSFGGEGGTTPDTDSDTDTDSDPHPEEEFGCRKVDFLFVIDNSGSMKHQQGQLLNSFPGFIEAIQASLGDTVESYHLGVVSSDAYKGNAPGCTSIGDLVSQTSGPYAAGEVCTPFAEGHRFATEKDDIAAKFPCMAQLGVGGSSIEQPVTACVQSLDLAKSGIGGCNHGFLREDAILVIVLVTDDPPNSPDHDDAHPQTDTSQWYSDVIAAKNDDAGAVVVVGFVPWGDVSCVALNLESPNLVGFVESFGERGVLASVCEPDFGPIFAEAIDTIASTCEDFDPIPG